MTAPAAAATSKQRRGSWTVAAWLTLRLHRFEIIAFGLAIGFLAVATILASVYLRSITPGPECRIIDESTPARCLAAAQAFDTWQSRFAAAFLAPLLVVTSVMGLILGVPIVARELERGTVRLAWSLGPVRWHWYVARVVPVLLITVALAVAAGIALDLFFAASSPGVDAGASFSGYGARGVVLAGRAMFLFAISVVIGAIFGRILPAVIVAALVGTIAIYGTLQLQQLVLRSEAITVPVDVNGSGNPNDLSFDQLFVLPDGTLAGRESVPNGNPYDENGNPLYPMVSLVVPAERYPFVVARETAVFALASVLVLLAGAAVVNRRRPT